MNENSALESEFRILGIDPDARFSDVERAYRWLRELYAPDSLATYSLFNEEERQARLERAEAAYRKICQGKSHRPSPRPQAPEAACDDGPPPDRAANPGRFLKSVREKAGLSLREIAERTKISPMKLGYLEEERFEKLPAPVYLRGFVMQYARELGLADAQDMAGRYLEKCLPVPADA